jgi:hypothetical protein
VKKEHQQVDGFGISGVRVTPTTWTRFFSVLFLPGRFRLFCPETRVERRDKNGEKISVCFVKQKEIISAADPFH